MLEYRTVSYKFLHCVLREEFYFSRKVLRPTFLGWLSVWGYSEREICGVFCPISCPSHPLSLEVQILFKAGLLWRHKAGCSLPCWWLEPCLPIGPQSNARLCDRSVAEVRLSGTECSNYLYPKGRKKSFVLAVLSRSGSPMPLDPVAREYQMLLKMSFLYFLLFYHPPHKVMRWLVNISPKPQFYLEPVARSDVCRCVTACRNLSTPTHVRRNACTYNQTRT